MATTGRSKKMCSTCNKLCGVFECIGCRHVFCADHAKDHREGLRLLMDQVEKRYQDYKHVDFRAKDQYATELMKQVEAWEHESILKIRQHTERLQQEIAVLGSDHNVDFQERLTQLENELNTAGRNQCFCEDELDRWNRILDGLGRTADTQGTASLSESVDAIPFISRLSLNRSSSMHSNTSLLVAPCQGPVKKGSGSPHALPPAEKHNLNMYSSKQNHMLFNITQFNSSHLVIFGIVSHSSCGNVFSFENSTFYGWTSDDTVYFAGEPRKNYDGYRSDFGVDNIIQLELNCDDRYIEMSNRSTGSKYRLNIDINKCPFEWHPCVRIITRT